MEPGLLADRHTFGMDRLGSILEAISIDDLNLLDADPPEAFDALTRLATRLFGVPVALISIVQEEADRQFFASQQGLPEPWAQRRQTPLTHSFCRHVKERNRPLIVTDATTDPLVRNNLAVQDLNVTAYLGMPILGPSGEPIGALCAIDENPREWSNEDLVTLGDLAKCVNTEILLRASLLANAQAHRRAQRYNTLKESIALAFMAPDMTISDRFSELLRAGCKALDLDAGLITKIDGDSAELLFVNDIDLQAGRGDGLSYSGSLSALVASGEHHCGFHDLQSNDMSGRHTLDGRRPGAYLGTPLIVGGVLFGTLEFSGKRPRLVPWGDEDLSMLSIIAMFACAHLGVFQQIRELKAAEAVLLQSLLAADHVEPVGSAQPPKRNFGPTH